MFYVEEGMWDPKRLYEDRTHAAPVPTEPRDMPTLTPKPRYYGPYLPWGWSTRVNGRTVFTPEGARKMNQGWQRVMHKPLRCAASERVPDMAVENQHWRELVRERKG